MFIGRYPTLCTTLFAALIGILPMSSRAATVDVTFTVPVEIQNIHADWSKVAVMCKGYQQPNSHGREPVDVAQVGEIDVSGKPRGSISQTVRGTIPVDENADRWVCFLFIQHRGESAPTFPRNTHEMRTTTGTIAEGAF